MPIINTTYSDRTGFLQMMHDFANDAARPNFSIHDWDSANQQYLTIKYIDPDYAHVLYYNFYIYSTNQGISMSVSKDWSSSYRTDYDLSHPGNAVTGVAGASYCQIRAYELQDEGAVTGVTFITDENYIAVIVEHSPGLYSHYLFGRNTGGPSRALYVCTCTAWYSGERGDVWDSRHSTFFGATSEAYWHHGFCDPGDGSLVGISAHSSADNRAHDTGHLYYSHEASPYSKALYPYLLTRFPAAPSYMSFLVPIPVVAEYTCSQYFYNRMGYLPGVAWTSIRYNNPGDTVTVGSEDYLVFPVRQKQPSQDYSSNDRDNSWDIGYAYKVV